MTTEEILATMATFEISISDLARECEVSKQNMAMALRRNARPETLGKMVSGLRAIVARKQTQAEWVVEEAAKFLSDTA
jgi:hypothetical protein